MNLNEFGSVVRKARIDAKVTLQEMARDLDVSAAYLSGLEVGRKRIPPEWAAKIQQYFKRKGVAVPDLSSLAVVANGTIPLEGLRPEQRMMLAGFARANLSPQQLERFSDLLREVQKEN